MQGKAILRGEGREGKELRTLGCAKGRECQREQSHNDTCYTIAQITFNNVDNIDTSSVQAI